MSNERPLARYLLPPIRTSAAPVVLLVVVGLFSTLFTTTANTRILSATPSNLQGRVMSVYSLMFLGMTPFGSFLSGAIAQRFGAPAVIIGGGSVTLAFTILVVFYRPTRQSGDRNQSRS